MTGAAVAAVTQAGVDYAFVPLWIQETLDIVRTLAIIAGAILIPLTIWLDGRRRQIANEREGRQRESRRATLELISTIASSASLMERQSRFYRYRKFLEKSAEAVNPYEETGTHAFIHDCFVMLNTYDAACLEILKEAVDEEMLYEAVRDAIIGTNTIFGVLEDVIGQNLSDNFPYLKEVSLKWQQRAFKDRIPPVLQIPDEKQPPASRHQSSIDPE